MSRVFSYPAFALADSYLVSGCRFRYLLCPELLHLGETLLWSGRYLLHPGSLLEWEAGDRAVGEFRSTSLTWVPVQ